VGGLINRYGPTKVLSPEIKQYGAVRPITSTTSPQAAAIIIRLRPDHYALVDKFKCEECYGGEHGASLYVESVNDFDITAIPGNNFEVVSPTVTKGGGVGVIFKISGYELKGTVSDLIITE
jgi:hypothetical protein